MPPKSQTKKIKIRDWNWLDEQRWQTEREQENDYVLCTLSRYANTKEGQAERYKAWLAPIEEAEYYLSKGRAYERSAKNVGR